jgi:hypothetical protein
MNINQIQPIETVPFQLIVAILFVAMLVISVLIYKRLGYRIDDVLKEAKECDLHLIETCKRLEKATLEQAVRLAKVRETLNKPLYEIGNTIWFNKGLDGTPGVHQEQRGTIIGVAENCSSIPDYKVLTSTQSEEIISQDLITAWTN